MEARLRLLVNDPMIAYAETCSVSLWDLGLGITDISLQASAPDLAMLLANANRLIEDGVRFAREGRMVDARAYFYDAIQRLEAKVPDRSYTQSGQLLTLLGTAYRRYLEVSTSDDPLRERYLGRWRIVQPGCQVPQAYVAQGPGPAPTRPPATIPPQAACTGSEYKQSANFCTYFQPMAYAEQLASRAECLRENQYRRLAGFFPSSVWNPRCKLNVIANLGRSGASTIRYTDPSGVEYRQIDINLTNNGVKFEVLQHEVTHNVLAGLVGKPAPRWADEGLAVLAEEGGFRRSWDALKLRKATRNNGLELREVIFADQYPEDVVGFYAVSAVLTNYFISEVGGGGDAGRRKFMDFVLYYLTALRSPDMKTRAYESALWEIYRVRSLPDALSAFGSYMNSAMNNTALPRHDTSAACLPPANFCPAPPGPQGPSTPPPPPQPAGRPTVVIYQQPGCGPCMLARNELRALALANNGQFRVLYEEAWTPTLGVPNPVNLGASRPVIFVYDSMNRTIYPPNNELRAGYDRQVYGYIHTALRSVIPSLRP